MIYRHRKRGTTYVLFDIIEVQNVELREGDEFRFYESSEDMYAFAEFQSSNGVFEGGHVVLYYAENDGKDYARPAVEFFDGRFERI